MWLVAINIGHNGSTALYNNSQLIFYIEEERLSKLKYDGNPFLGLEKAFQYTDRIDHLLLCYTSNNFPIAPWTGEDYYSSYIRKKQPGYPLNTVKFGNNHHLLHATTAFYNSGFDDAAGIVVDGAGSRCEFTDVLNGLKDRMNINNRLPSEDEVKEWVESNTWEVESIWTLGYPSVFKRHYVNYGSNNIDMWSHHENDTTVEISYAHGITKSYEAVTKYLGFHPIDAGKTMGIASYGNINHSIMIDDGKFNNMLLMEPKFPSSNSIRLDTNPELKKHSGDSTWHENELLIDDYRKDLAYAVQKSSERRVTALIQKTIEITKKKKIVMSGGYILNCVANYGFLKKFPNIEFYHEPISHDGGTVMGACQLYYRNQTGDKTKTPQKSLYIGPENSIDYENTDYTGFTLSDITAKEVAQLIIGRNIVALFQGRSEAGPRALGNRSLLFDPTHKNGKEIVNRVKKREWFRPFAGSCLAEYVNEWFDMAGIAESPHMMYAVEVLEDKKDVIPSITHVDGTCRIQTVTSEQNPHYYELISEFNKIKNVPILFNTSFNLAGDPLVETIEDALYTLRASDIKYLWLPEIKKLVTKI